MTPCQALFLTVISFGFVYSGDEALDRSSRMGFILRDVQIPYFPAIWVPPVSIWVQTYPMAGNPSMGGGAATNGLAGSRSGRSRDMMMLRPSGKRSSRNH